MAPDLLKVFSGEDNIPVARRKVLMRIWIAIATSAFIIIFAVCFWSLSRSHQVVTTPPPVPEPPPTSDASQHVNMECWYAPSLTGDRRKNKDLLRVANFNVEWLFLHGGTGEIQCPGACPWKNYLEAMSHLQKVANIITILDADIINLNEIEDCRVLHELLNYLPKNHGYKYYMVPGKDTNTGQSPGFLSRVDPISDLYHSNLKVDFPLAGSTCPPHIVGRSGCAKHYITRFAIKNASGKELSLLMAGVHLLAGPDDTSRCGRREAQGAVLAKAILKEKKPNDFVILTGDFNDYDNMTPGKGGHKSITGTLNIVRTQLNLYNACHMVPQDSRFSHYHYQPDNPNSGYSLIDHMLVSPELRIRSANFYHSFKSKGKDRVSDHWPFVMELDLS